MPEWARWTVYCCVAVGLVVAVSGDSIPACPPGPSTIPSLVRFGLPEGCISNTTSDGASCDYFLAMSPNENNNNFLDIHLEGSPKGWIAVGFSTDQLMGNDDVLGCKQYGNQAGPIDSWNPDPRHTPNKRDPNQDGICPYMSQYADGRIGCTFSRYYAIVNPSYDFDLKSGYYLLLGMSDIATLLNVSLSYHTPNTPSPTSNKCNPFTGEGCGGSVMTSTFKNRLIMAHGVLMVTSWLLLAVSGIYFAAWMKPTFPDGKWFHIHRVLMIASLVLTTIALVLIFVSNKNSHPTGLITFDCSAKTTHFIIGLLVVGLQYANPIIALFRCKPNTPRRWLFNLLHATIIGRVTIVLALINIGIGLGLFQSTTVCARLSRYSYLVWIYLGWLVFSLALEGLMYITTTIFAFNSTGEERLRLVHASLRPIVQYFSRNTPYESMNKISVENNLLNNETVKLPKKSKDTPLRIAAFCMQLSATTIVVVILAIFISLGK